MRRPGIPRARKARNKVICGNLYTGRIPPLQEGLSFPLDGNVVCFGARGVGEASVPFVSAHFRRFGFSKTGGASTRAIAGRVAPANPRQRGVFGVIQWHCPWMGGKGVLPARTFPQKDPSIPNRSLAHGSASFSIIQRFARLPLPPRHVHRDSNLRPSPFRIVGPKYDGPIHAAARVSVRVHRHFDRFRRPGRNLSGKPDAGAASASVDPAED